MSKEVRTFKEVKLNTLHMYDECDRNDSDYMLWQKIAEYMNGETAFVTESSACDGKYIFLGLKDPVKDKELFYMMEQDSMVGIFINDREGFDKAYENKEYTPDCNIYLEPQYLIFEQEEKMSDLISESEAKPQKVITPHGIAYECRNCGNELNVNSFNGNYCHWCGIKLNWNKELKSETEKIIEQL